jgi:signal transduction histidine kinase
VGSPSSRPGSGAPWETLRKLQAVTDAALAHLSLDALLDALLSRVRNALETDTCAVLLLDESGEYLVPRAAKGLEEEAEAGVRIPVGKGFAGRVASERRPVAIADVGHSEVLNPILREKGVKSLLGAPLVTQGSLLGVIHVGTLHHRTFSPEDTELLQVVADRVALAVGRALIHDELIRFTRLQREFVSFAAHELRSPAANIFGIAATLRARASQLASETVDELQETLYRQSDRMRRLVEQLLDLSRLEAATVAIAPVRIRLGPEIEEIVAATAGRDPKEVAVVVVPAELEVMIDPTALERVVGNLVANALNHGEPPVTISAEHLDRHLRIAVEDSGRGVSDDFVPFMFERFRRSEESRSGTPVGSGLGLAIARAYARALGGDLLYAPQGPEGARFELVVPVGNG